MTLVLRTGPQRRHRGLSPAEMMEAGAVTLLAAYGAALVLALMAGAWLVGRAGAPNAFDFAEFWSAGRMAAMGHAARAYDWNALAGLLKAQGTRAFDRTGFPFFYPPPVLLVLVPLGLLPFALAAALAFVGAAAAWGGLACGLHPERAGRLVLAASPSAFLCLAVGQTGLMVAVLAGAALIVLPRRPLLAGLLLAAVAMKPQTAVLFPVALAAAGRWRTLCACTVALAGLAALSMVAFGPGVWGACLHALHPANGAPAPLAGLPPAKLQSVYGLLLACGAGRTAAMVAQGASALAAAGWSAWLWRGERPYALKAAGLCAAALLVSPYSAAYDLPVTALALGFLLRDAERRTFGRTAATALALAYLLPLLFPFAPFPYGPAICFLLCATVAVRAGSGTGASPVATTGAVAAA